MWRLVSPAKGVPLAGGAVAVYALGDCVVRGAAVSIFAGVVGDGVIGERGLQAEKIRSEKMLIRRIFIMRGIGLFQYTRMTAQLMAVPCRRTWRGISSNVFLAFGF
jgi:hypothetical protein